MPSPTQSTEVPEGLARAVAMHLTSHSGNEIICLGIDAVNEALAEIAAPAIREPLEDALQEAEDRFVSCDNCERPSREEDLKTIWCQEPESGEQVDARICLVCRLEAERDEAVNQEGQRIQEALGPVLDLLATVESDYGKIVTVARGTTLDLKATDIAAARQALLDTLDPSGEGPK